MQTIRLKVNDKANDKLLSSYKNSMNKDEDIFTENPDFERQKNICMTS